MLYESKLSAAAILRFLSILAQRAWEKIQYAEIQRRTGLSPITQKNLLLAMESIFLLRRIPILDLHGDTFILEDQLEEYALSKGNLDSKRQVIGAVYWCIRGEGAYRMGSKMEFSTYRSRDGAVVPVVVATPDSMLGVLVIEGETPSLSERRSAESLLRRFAHSKVIFLVNKEIPPRVLNERLKIAALYAIL